MSAVKQSRRLRRFSPLLFALALAGCAKADLIRFAPPGIVKYEEIAGDEPVNPVVAERIRTYRDNPDARGFPNLSEAPGPGDRPARPGEPEIASRKETLQGARNALEADIAADRAQAAEDLSGDIAAERETLREQLEKDTELAERERRRKLEAPPPPDEK